MRNPATGAIERIDDFLVNSGSLETAGIHAILLHVLDAIVASLQELLFLRQELLSTDEACGDSPETDAGPP